MVRIPALVSALFILYLTLDFAIPTLPGAVQFPDESVDAAKASRPSEACEVAEILAVPQPVPIDPLIVVDMAVLPTEITSHRRTVNPAARRVPDRTSRLSTPEDH
jgi:hypothetical protein